LSQLARFGDIQLVMDRTRRSSGVSGRSFESILPDVTAGAWKVNPAATLDWLEQTDSKLKDQCLLQIVKFISIQKQFKLPEHRDHLERLANLLMKIESPKRRLTALAYMVNGLEWLEVPVPAGVREQGRRLLAAQADFQAIDLRDDEQSDWFALGTSEQQRQLLERKIKTLSRSEDYEQQVEFSQLGEFIKRAKLPAEQRLDLLRRMVAAAGEGERAFLVFTLAPDAVPLDPAWAIETICSILPPDRGRSGNKQFMCWTPAPSTAADAIQRLHPLHHKPLPNSVAAPLTAALWQFLPRAHLQDRDGIRLGLCRLLLEQGYPQQAAGIAAAIEDPFLLAKARLSLLRRHRRN
jgi:hypothetical protein